MADKRIFDGVWAAAALLVAAAGLAGCVSQADGDAVTASVAQPAHATYRCDSGQNLVVENSGGSVRLTDPDGEQVDLPAAPASQRSRYGRTPYALVLDGVEALYMKNGRTPLTCRR
jgi:hypothetical protein